MNSLKIGKVISGNAILTKTHVLSRPSNTELWKNLFIYIRVQTHSVVFLSSCDKQEETKRNKAVSMRIDKLPPSREPKGAVSVSVQRN